MCYRNEEKLRLAKALSNQFPEEEAINLAKVLSQAYRRESISYDEIDVALDLKDDIILLAYEERMLLPMKSLGGSAWEDRILNLSEGERYHLPRVVRFLVAEAEETGQWHPAFAIARVLKEAGEGRVEETADFLNRLREMAPRYRLEAGLMQAVSLELGLDLDMHDSIDRFVRCGIMSACTRRSLRLNIAEYEINRCLYWGSS